MKVSKEIVKEWDSLKEKGDTKKIAALLDVTLQRASNIITSGEGPVSHISKIQKFFKKRKEIVSKIENDMN